MGHDGITGWGMGTGMWLIGGLVLLVLVLSVAALLKYLFGDKKPPR